MNYQVPTHLHAERDALMAEIRTAFKDVTRNGGISWNECDARDGYGTDEECAHARLSDTDTHWSQLVDDPAWDPFPGTGGFAFIDGIGFRYYLPPTMIRFLRGEITEWFPGHLLQSINGLVLNSSRFWTDEQVRCVARFIDLMSRLEYPDWNHPHTDVNPWKEALVQYWNQRLK